MHCQCLAEYGQALIVSDRQELVANGTEIILKVSAAGVCHSDLHIQHGGYDLGRGETLSFQDRGLKLPLILGHETAGVVESRGPLADAIDTSRTYLIYPWQGCGDCFVCNEGRENYCVSPRFTGMYVDGGYATHIKVPHAKYLFDIGDMDPAAAAPLACSGLTAFSALKKVEHTIDRLPLVIIGAGGLGLMCIGLLKAMGGLAPVVVDIDPVKRDAAMKAGARAVVDGAAPDAAEQISQAVGNMPMAVIDFVGAETTAALGFNVVGKGGSLVIVGLFGGAAPWSLPLIAAKAVTIMGGYLGNLAECTELMALVARGLVPPLPTSIFNLDDANLVLKKLEAGEIVGRAVLVP